MYKDVITRLGLTSTFDDEVAKFCIRAQNEAIILGDIIEWALIDPIMKQLAFKLGIKKPYNLYEFFPNDFNQCIITTEMLIHVLIDFYPEDKSGISKALDSLVSSIKYSINESIFDLGIIYDEENFKFIKKGDELFDSVSLSETLLFLKEYPTAKEFYSNALTDLLQTKYKDALTKSYSALESVIKTHFNNNKTLENNIENIIKLDFFNDNWKSIFKNFCQYAHEFSSRHGKNDSVDSLPELSVIDTETYIYMTGILIRHFVNVKK